jgi:hypothetical protein
LIYYSSQWIQPSGVPGTGGGGSALVIKDEGTTISSAATSLNFVGSGVTATNSADAITVTVSAGTLANLDGGTPSTSYGGITAIDAGTP